VLLRGEPVGILEVGYWRMDRPKITPEEVRLLDGMADQMAIAVGNARLFDDSQRQLTELAVVNEISRTLTATPDLLQLFVTIHQQVGRLFEASNFYIATYDGGDEWSLDYQYEHNQLLPPARHKMGRGFTSYILQNRQPLLIRSAQENTTFHQQHDLPQIGETAKSWMGVPLIVAGSVTGVMGIQSYEREWLYNEQNVALFSTIGTQAAAAIQNARLLQEARVRANELAALNELSRTLASQLSVQQVLDEVWHGVSSLLDTTNFYIALYDAERQEVSFPVNASESALDQEITVMPANQGLTGYLIRTRQPLLIKEDVKRTVEQLGLEHVGADAQSFLGVPIAIGDQILGVVAIQSYTTARVYNEHDQDLLVAIAGQTAIALQNARLFEETRQRNAELATLNQIISSASETLDLHGLLDIVLKQTLEVFEFDGGLITLFNEPRQKLERVVRTGLPGGIPDDPAEGLENSLCNYVFISQKELVIEDFRQGAPVDVSGEIQNGYLSYIGIPLESRGRMLGTWCGFRKQAGGFGKNTLALIKAVGHQAAFAIENARLFAQTQATLAETEQIYAASQRLTSAASLQDAVAAMIESVPIADINRAVLWSFERDKRGQVSAAVVAANWYSGQGTLVAPIGVRLAADAAVIKHFLTAEPIFSSNLPTDPHIDPATAAMMQQQNINAITILPLWATGLQIGVLLLEAEVTHTFTDAEIRPYTSLSQQLATTIYNQQLLEQTQRSSRQLTALNELGQAVSQQIEINQVLEATYQRLQPLVSVDAFMAVLYDQETHTISFPLVYDEGRRYTEPSVPFNPRSSTGQVILTGNSILTLLTAQELADIVVVPGAVGNVNKPSASLLYTPLKIGARTLGVLSIQSYQLNAYDNDTVQVISSVANQVAISIQNARLLEQSRRTAKREQTLRELTARVRSSSDPDTIVRTAVRELGLALGRPTFVRLGDAEQLTKKPPATAPASDNGSDAESEGGQ
jgi:GAF domain-containing protein